MQLRKKLLFINEDTKGIEVLTVDGAPVALRATPATVELTIVETDPSIKGASCKFSY